MAGSQQDWNTGFEAVPAGTDPGSTLDTVIQDLKVTLRVILQRANILLTDSHGTISSNQAHDGRQIVNGDEDDGDWTIYDSTNTSKVVTVTNTAITAETGVSFAGTNVTSGDNPGHAHESTVTIPLPVAGTGVVQGVTLANRGNGPLTIVSAEIVCFTPPSGGTLVMDCKRYALSPTGDPSSASTVMWTGLTVTTGNYSSGSPLTSFTTDTITDGTAIVFDVTGNTGNADDVSVILKVKRS